MNEELQRISDQLYSIIFNAWDRGDLTVAQVEGLAGALGRKNYTGQLVCAIVARKLTDDLKIDHRMALKREGAGS